MFADLTPNRSLREAIEEEKRRLGAQQTTHTAPVIGDSAAERVVAPMIPVEYQIQLACRPVTPEENAKMVVPVVDSDEESFLLHASLLAPDVELELMEDGHIPTDIVLIIDISGSMNNDAPPPKGKQVHESANLSLSLLDLVKHATNTVIETLTEYDRLALVSFSNSAQIVFDFTVMTDVGKRLASSRLKSLEADGMTNLWDGLFKGLELLKARFDPQQPALSAGLAQRNSTILLLTDGEPNIEPPRGILPMLKRYTERPENKFQGVINTFGFGYSLHSHLLRDIAIQGNGMYAFIPDSGFVGTAFVNALANTLSTVVTDAELTVMPGEGVRIFPIDGLLHAVRPITLPANSPKPLKTPVGTMQMGQSVDRMFYMTIKKNLLTSPNPNPSSLLASFTLNRASARGVAFGSSQQTLLSQNIVSEYSQLSQSEDDVDKLQYQLVRYRATKTIQAVYENMKMSKKEEAVNLVDSFVSEMNELTSGNLSYTLSQSQQRIKDLTRDFSGQISEAVSREEWWRKWGIHYLPSLQRAHELQQCNNFKVRIYVYVYIYVYVLFFSV